MRILIADDRASSRELLRIALETVGYEVSEARDGEEAVSLARELGPDLIVLDMQMPTVDGAEAVRLLRQDPRFATLPIIALTAYGVRGDREKALTAGFTSYLSKPVAVSVLRAEVARLLLP
jgi:two-component system cell cycle response regulator DivK